MADRRSWIKALAADTRIFVEVEGAPPGTYAIGLHVLRDGEWQVVRLIDNAHGNHEMHKYNGLEKRPGEPFTDGPVRQAIPMAIEYLAENWQRIVEEWQR